jgi:protoporphyrinogen oxidase
MMTTLSPSLSPPFASYATKKNRNTTLNTTERRRSIILRSNNRSSSSLLLRRRKAMRTTTTVSSSESESPIIMNKDDDYDENDEKTASSDDDNNGIIIIGGGLAGLAAAVQLETKNIPYVLLESSDGFGGRARTDIVDGYILDRGFAIYLSSYEECNKIFDTKALDLRKFYAGADVRFENQFYRVADPFRHVSDALPSLLPNHKIGSPLDKVLVGLVRFQTLLLRMNPMQRESSETIEERLNTFGFSEEMVDRFFRPFLGGIFFNPELTTDSRLFDFVMRSLALGENCLPAKGIGAMAEQLVGRLDEKNVHANAKVQEIRNVNDAVEVRVQMMNKEEETIIRGKKVILAVEGPECDRLLGTKDKQREKGVGTTCVYFSCDKPYDAENAMLYLDGEKYKGGGGKKTLVNNCCFPSVVSPTYAPNGKHLCSASIIGVPSELSDEQIGDRVKSELSDWFGESITSSFKLLKVYRIPFAQPIQTPSAKGSSKTAFEQTCESGAMKNVYLAGDHRDAATFDGALISGRRCAEYAKSKM